MAAARYAVFIDDKPTTAGAANRALCDGFGWGVNTGSYPTNLGYSVAANTLTISWPATHRGWVLQSTTNAPGLITNWYDLPGSSSQTQAVTSLGLGSGTTFFRLRRP